MRFAVVIALLFAFGCAEVEQPEVEIVGVVELNEQCEVALPLEFLEPDADSPLVIDLREPDAVELVLAASNLMPFETVAPAEDGAYTCSSKWLCG